MLIPGLLFGFVCIVLSLAARDRPKSAIGRLYQTAFALCAADFILAFRMRWNMIPGPMCANGVSGDEAQWLAHARQLAGNWGGLWNSFDPTTSGPLNIFPLAVVHALNPPLTYQTMRFWGVAACVVPSVLFTFFALCRLFGPRVGRIAILPLLFSVALVGHYSIVAYNSLLIPALLLSLAFFLYAGLISGSTAPVPLALLGFTLGCVPWAKLQAGPPAAVMMLWTLIHIAGINDSSLRKKRLFLFGVSCLLPTVSMLVYVLFTNDFTDFWRRFIVYNMWFSAKGIYGKRIESAPALFPPEALRVRETASLWILSLASLLSAGVLCIKKRIPPRSKEGSFILFSLSLLTASVYSVTCNGGIFLAGEAHYQGLLFVPMAAVLGISFGTIYQTSYNSLLRFLSILLIAGAGTAYPVFSHFSPSARYPSSGFYAGFKAETPVYRIVRAFAQPGEKIAVWGWEYDILVATNTLQGTRDGHCVRLITPGPQQDYFLSQYISDLLRNNPVMFVEARAVACRVPAIRKIIDTRYKLYKSFKRLDLYVRNDRLAQRLREHKIDRLEGGD